MDYVYSSMRLIILSITLIHEFMAYYAIAMLLRQFTLGVICFQKKKKK
jgi:hypothetical protein